MPRQKRDIPWLDTEGNGVYHIYWYDATKRRTRRKSLKTTEPASAQRQYARFLMDPTELEGRTEDTLSVAQCLTDYERDHVNATVGGRPKVVDKDRVGYAIKNLRVGFCDTSVKDIDIPMCRAYTRQRERGEVGQPSGAGTIRRELGVLTAAINIAVKWKRLPKEHAPFVEMPAPPPPKDLWLTRDEITNLIKCADPRIADFVSLAYWTASRRTAIEKLTGFQVDLDNGRINLNPQGRAQTNKRRPIVPIAAELRPTIERLMTGWTSGPLLGGASIRKGFARAVAAAGCPGVTPHTLRHSRAVHLAQAGVSIYAIAGLLGDSIATVERNYLHHCPDHLAATIVSESTKGGGV